MFLEFWKRRQFELSYEWDLVDYDEERDIVRPEYEAHVTRERLNPINHSLEPYLDPIAKFSRSTFSVVTVGFWVSSNLSIQLQLLLNADDELMMRLLAS